MLSVHHTFDGKYIYFTMLSVHRTFDGKNIFFKKVMGNENRMRFWDEKMAQYGWKGGIALDKLKWGQGEEAGCDAALLVLLAFPPQSSSSNHLISSYFCTSHDTEG
jgi:hypothetical protein